MMSKTEMIIRSILGPSGGDIRPMAVASDLFAKRMFEEHIHMDDIQLTKDIYPSAAVMLDMKSKSFGRKIERIANRFWDFGDRRRLSDIAGRKLLTPPSVKDCLTYLAFYSHKGIPLFIAIQKEPSLLFEQDCIAFGVFPS